MRRRASRQCTWPGLLAVAAALAPAQQAPAPPQAPAPAPAQEGRAPGELEALARARVASAIRMYDLGWVYYSENRIDAGDMYGYSRLMLSAEQDLAADKPARVEAYRGHLDRMERLWKKVSRVRKLGFGSTLDINESEYYLREAEFWLAREKAWEEK